MNVKGSALGTLPLFVKDKFGEDGYQKWLDALSPEAQNIFKINPLASSWYPLKESFLEPTKTICDLFYGGDSRGAWESGRFSAEKGLKGVYKMFIKIASAQFLVKKASTILPTYYDPCNMDLIETGEKNACLHITKFEDSDPLIDKRICGWIERALEICGCKNVQIKIPKSLANGDPVTELNVSWE